MNKKYNALKEYQVIKFQDRFNYMINKLKSNGMNINVPELTSFHIEFTDEITEDKINDILENCKTAYSPYTKTIYIHESFVDAPQLEYHFTKRMLEHMSTKIEKDKVLSGLSISSENLKFNHSLNQAIIENVTNTLLGNETLEEDTFAKYIIERHHLAQIENIVGLETIMNSFLNSDFILLETRFDYIGSNFKSLVSKMDRLADINYIPNTKTEPNENTLTMTIFNQLLDAYIKKSTNNKKVIDKESFESHIITPQTVRGAFGTPDKFGYEGIDRSVDIFKSVIKGVEEANKLSNDNKEAVRSIM